MARIYERMKLKKKFKSQKRYELFLRGRGQIERWSKEGIYLGSTPFVKNVIQNEGFDEFLLNIAGTSTKDLGSNGPHLDATLASVGINNSATPGSYVFTQVGTDVGPTGGTNTKSSPRYTMLWEWHDISANTYSNANWMHFWYGDPEGSAGDEYNFASVNIAAGNKPVDENWLYRFELELYSADTDFTDAGLQLLMNLLGGVESLHLDASGIKLRPTTGAGSGSELSGSDEVPDGAPTVDTVGDDITWVFTVEDGKFEGSWAGTKIKVGTSFLTNLRWGGCKTDGSSCGTKSSGEEWEYTYIIGISQGA